MIPSLEFTFLGTGPSVGVPVMTCECPICTGGKPKNQRLRASLWVRTPEVHLIVDAGPDLREQALKFNIHRADAVLFTHGHVDHVGGFDELRAFCWRREDPLPTYLNAGTLEILKRMFSWAFDHKIRGYVRPAPILFEGQHQIGDLRFEALPIEHGTVETSGMLFHHPSLDGPFAYLPDVKSVPNSSLKRLRGLDTLVIDTLRDTEHETHLSLPETLELIAELKPKRAFLTHLSHEFDYDELQSRLPEGVSPAYDGLTLSYP